MCFVNPINNQIFLIIFYILDFFVGKGGKQNFFFNLDWEFDKKNHVG